MGKLLVFLGGAVAGSIIGSVTALLLTPYSGKDLREQAAQRYQTMLEEGRHASEERRQQLIAEYEAMKRGEVQIFPK